MSDIMVCSFFSFLSRVGRPTSSPSMQETSTTDNADTGGMDGAMRRAMMDKTAQKAFEDAEVRRKGFLCVRSRLTVSEAMFDVPGGRRDGL